MTLAGSHFGSPSACLHSQCQYTGSQAQHFCLFVVVVLLCFVFEIYSLYVVLVVLDLIVQIGLVLRSQTSSSCLCLPSTKIKGRHHHTGPGPVLYTVLGSQGQVLKLSKEAFLALSHSLGPRLHT